MSRHTALHRNLIDPIPTRSTNHTRIYVTCPVCNGNLVVPCLLCHGTGQSRHTDKPCAYCATTGWKRCYTCDGVGEILCEVHSNHTILHDYIAAYYPTSTFPTLELDDLMVVPG